MRNKTIRCIQYGTFAWRNMPSGLQRRLAIIDHVLQMRIIYVNCKWMPQIKEDSDLKKLLKDGTLVQARDRFPKTSRKTYLTMGEIK